MTKPQRWYRTLILSALSLGVTGCAMIWCNSCFSQEFRFQVGLRVIFVVSVAFVFLLLAWDARNNIQDQLEDDTQQVAMTTCSLLWKVLKENRRSVLFICVFISALKLVTSFGRKRGPKGFYLFSHYQVCCWNRSTSNDQ